MDAAGKQGVFIVHKVHKIEDMPHPARIEENAFGSKQAARRSSVSLLSPIDAERVQRMRHFPTNIPNGSVVLLQKMSR